jgi:hypothetical protein
VLQDGTQGLPGVRVLDKCETFRSAGQATKSFRLMASSPDGSVLPAVSGKFTVKTTRAINDYEKHEYPHYKSKLTYVENLGPVVSAGQPACAQGAAHGLAWPW